MLGLISARLTGDIPHTKAHPPWRQWVLSSISCGAVWPRVNVPNHVNSLRGTNTPGVATRMLGPISMKLTGDFHQTKAHLPWRWQVSTSYPCRAVWPGVNVPNHVTEPPRATIGAPTLQMWRSLAPCLNLPWEKNSEPPVAQVPHLIHHPHEYGGGCRVSLWAISSSKNQIKGISPPSGGGDGDMFPTLELKTPGPLLKGDRRYSLPAPPSQTWGRLSHWPWDNTPQKTKVVQSSPKLFGGGHGCGEVCCEDGRWIEASPLEHCSLEQMCQIMSTPLRTNTPGVATRTLGPISMKLTGDLYQTKGHHSWRQQVHTSNPLEAALPQVNVPNHVMEPPARDEAPCCAGPCLSPTGLNFLWKLNTWSDLLKTHRPLTKDLLCWRWQVPTIIPHGAVHAQVNVPNDVWRKYPRVATWMLGSMLMKLAGEVVPS